MLRDAVRPGALGQMRHAEAYGFTRIDEDEESAAPTRPLRSRGCVAFSAHDQQRGDGTSASQAASSAVGYGSASRGSASGQTSDRKHLKQIMREKGAAFDGMKRGPSHSRFEPEEVRKAATKIQRWYRGVCAMYAAFGPMMFSRKDGRMSDFGTVSFLSGTSAAKWIRISDTTSVGALAHFMEKFWRLPRPDVLISVTGSAASLQLTSTLQRVFDRGLATAAAMTNAWIFTGGTDSGVMKLVGDAIHKYGLDVPLVGIMPWGAVQNRRTLHGAKGDVIPYHTKASSSLLEGKLNPHHTHQILVDAVREYGEGDVAWGHEIHMRSQLERVYAQAKGVPVVLLVVQGGQTLAMMASSARARLAAARPERFGRSGDGAVAILRGRHRSRERPGVCRAGGGAGGAAQPRRRARWLAHLLLLARRRRHGGVDVHRAAALPLPQPHVLPVQHTRQRARPDGWRRQPCARADV